jgi:hypothetical protein
MEVHIRAFLTSALYGVVGQLHVSADPPLHPNTHRTGEWVGSRAGLDAVAKRNQSLHYPYRKSNPGRPVRSLVIILTELPRFDYIYVSIKFEKLGIKMFKASIS